MDLSATIIINRPAAEVFEYVVEVSHDAEWRGDVVEAAFTSDDPIDVSSTGFDRIDVNGREIIATWTVFAFEPAGFVRWTLDSGPIRGSAGYICVQDGDNTNFTLEANVRPAGWYWLLGPFFGMIVRRQNLSDVRRLKTILENPTREGKQGARVECVHRDQLQSWNDRFWPNGLARFQWTPRMGFNCIHYLIEKTLFKRADWEVYL